MAKSIIRTDKWNLNPVTEDKLNLLATVDEYRAFCKALSYVILGHWVKGVVKSSWLRKSDWAPPTAKQSRSQKSCHQLLARIIRRANIGLTLSGCQVAPGIFNLF